MFPLNNSSPKVLNFSGVKYLSAPCLLMELLGDLSFCFGIYAKKYGQGLSFIIPCSALISIDFTHLLQGYFTGIGAIVGLPQCQWSNPEEFGWMDRIN